jgi:hypothetical protein
MVGNDIPVHRVGLTVFNNAAVTLHAKKDFNDIVTRGIQARLASTRPDWKVQAVTPPAAILERINAKNAGGDAFRAIIRDITLPLIADGNDAVVIVIPSNPQYSPFTSGAGVLLRTMSLTTVKVARVFGTVNVMVAVRDGSIAASQGTVDNFTFTDIPVTDLRLDDDIQNKMTPATQSLIEEAIEKQYARAVEKVLGQMGY